MACRFPQADGVDRFWSDLKQGRQSTRRFSRREMLEAGADSKAIEDPAYVRAGTVLEGIELFDAAFFGFTPREAQILDPQQRIFLECAWEALERAGHSGHDSDLRIGVYAGSSENNYRTEILSRQPRLLESIGSLQLAISSEKDYLATQTAYRLNLKGPCINVNTACSTSLVAVHLACQSLADLECDMALAGGVSITLPQKRGYLYQEGGIASPDGRCRAFDAQAKGTFVGSGAGVVVLRRLEDALAEGDPIAAVILGSAVNNDGADKIGFTAPSQQGQAEVIAEAHALAGVEADSISYVEAHGTGTPLGDVIEMAALQQVFAAAASRGRSCALGSVKTNIGHCDAAAGVAGLIKTVLCLQHGQLPASLDFEVPNPQIELDAGPFHVNARLREWTPEPELPRRAGVSSFGIGGTNAHAVLEEAPRREPSDPSKPWQLLALSAKTADALQASSRNLVEHLEENPDIDLADAAFTLQVGRKAFSQRRIAVCRTAAEGAAALSAADHPNVVSGDDAGSARPVAFAFPGHGNQYPQMGLELYRSEPVFQARMDRCSDILRPLLGLDLRCLLYPGLFADKPGGVKHRIDAVPIAHSAIFAIEASLAHLWRSWGVQPQALIGHSLGEFAAACVAGVFTLEDALFLVARRAQLISRMPQGGMLAAELSPSNAKARLNAELSLAAINGPSSCTFSGTPRAIAALERELAAEETACRRLASDRAFHSRLLSPAQGKLREALAKVRLQRPSLPLVSGMSGRWLEAEEATDPEYWTQQLCRTVEFDNGLQLLFRDPERALLEVGPGQTLTGLAARNPARSEGQPTVSSLPRDAQEQSEAAFLLQSLGKLWTAGVEVDWHGLHHNEKRHRLVLPTYPFQRRKHWVESPMKRSGPECASVHDDQDETAGWLYRRTWQRLPRPGAEPAPWEAEKPHCLVFAAEDSFSHGLAKRLRSQCASLTWVMQGDAFQRIDRERYRISAGQEDHYRALLDGLARDDRLPRRIVHCWTAGRDRPHQGTEAGLEACLNRGCFSLQLLSRSLNAYPRTGSTKITVISTGLHNVTGDEPLIPENATLIGPVATIGQGFPGLACRSLDVVLPEPGSAAEESLLDVLAAEWNKDDQAQLTALRDGSLWMPSFERLAAPLRPTSPSPIRTGGTYWITGGLGGIGSTLAEHLARTAQANLILSGRLTLPRRDRWQAHLDSPQLQAQAAAKISRIRAIEKQGGRVLYLCADVSDRARMKAAYERARSRFGSIDGIIHAAGIADRPGDWGIETARRVLSPKLEGTLILTELMKDEQIAFMALCSSLTAALGDSLQMDYISANAFLDAFAQGAARNGGPSVVSINWERWLSVGMAARALNRSDRTEADEPSWLGRGLTPREGVEAFQRALACGLPQVLVSPNDLRNRIDSRPADRRLRSPNGQPGPSKALPSAAGGALQSKPTRDALQQRLAGIWRDLLGVEELGLHDDFFQRGGHSLMAAQLNAAIRREFGVNLPFRDLLRNTSIAAMAACIESASDPGKAAAPLIEPQPRGSHLPLSFAQQRLWFLCRVAPRSPFYNVPSAWSLIGQLDLAALEASLTSLLDRHEALRTCFPEVAGQPVQAIAPRRRVRVPLIDLSRLAPERRRECMTSLIQREARRPFELLDGDVIRTALLRLDGRPESPKASWVLLVVIHHIVVDAWSMEIFEAELSQSYRRWSSRESRGGTRQGEATPEPPVQYADFAIWQHRWLGDEAVRDQLSYWRQYLKGVAKLQLPTDHRRPKVPRFRGGTVAWALGERQTESLRSLGRKCKATLFMTMLTAFQVLMHRWTGQKDIAVGCPIANRPYPELEKVFGMFVNTLVLRCDLSGQPSFLTLLAQVRRNAQQAYANQDVPFEKLVDGLLDQRDPSRNPLYQAAFSLQDAPRSPLQLQGLAVAPVEADPEASRCDLELHLREWEGAVQGAFSFARDLFRRCTIERMGRHLHVLIDGILQDPAQHLSRLPLLTPQERRHLTIELNSTDAPIGECFVHRLFEAQAASRPEAIALAWRQRRLSYGQLNRRANRLARRLRSLGLGPERLAAICMERTPEMIVAMLGVLKAGGAYLPLDSSNPQHRLVRMLREAKVQVLLTLEPAAAQLASCAEFSLALEQEPQDRSKDASSFPEVEGLSQANLAYAIYTSGSSGSPKAVAISHAGLANLVAWQLRRFRLGPGDRASQIAGIGFDAAGWEIWPCLAAGATLFIAEGWDRYDPVQLLSWLARHRINACFMPTPLAEAALREEWPARLDLRVLFVGGDKLHGESLGRASVTVFNLYGPTENSVCSTFHRVGEGAADPPIGKPLDNVRMHILDDGLQLVPIGVRGELFASGLGLARCYLGNPGLTAERFLPDPLSPRPGQRIYRTGDLARRNTDGLLEFLGRVDQQVKVRGCRIEPAEIESALLQHPSVDQAAVTASAAQAGGQRLTAHVASKQDEGLVRELQRFLADRLPEYMLPTRIKRIPRLPFTPNGKLDRKALAAEVAGDPEEGKGRLSSNPIEIAVRETWRSLLGVDRIEKDDDFFSLGGHSLLAARAASSIRKAFNVELPLRDFLENPTVEALSLRISAALKQGPDSTVPPLVAQPRRQPIPLSFAQRRLWFLDALIPENPFYNISAAWRISGFLRISALQRALDAVAARHEVLRTCFPRHRGQPRQRILPQREIPLAVVDLTRLPSGLGPGERNRLSRQAADRSFDLERGPLIRAVLIVPAAPEASPGQAKAASTAPSREQSILLLALHHIIADGWSLGILLDEISRLYPAYAGGAESPAQGTDLQLPALDVQYADYAIWQRRWLQGQARQRQIEYWSRRLKGLSALELPLDHARPSLQRFRGDAVQFTLPSETLAGLRSLGRRQGATLFMVLLAAFQALLHRLCGSKDIAVGTPVAGRHAAETEGLIGFFSNTLVLRSQVKDRPRFLDFLAAVSETTLEALAHQDLPFEELVEHLQPQRDLSRAPLFQVLMALHNFPFQDLRMAGLHVSPQEIEARSTRFDLELQLAESDAVLSGGIAFDRSLFAADSIRRMARQYACLLKGVVGRPETPLDELPVSDEEERRQLLRVLSEGAERARALFVHQLFEAQVQATPDAPAVAWRGLRLDYAQLNQRANRLARRLQKAGAGPEVRVAVCLQRGLSQATALLGVLKSGGVYVPLDPADPAARLEFMLRDSRARLLVTDGFSSKGLSCRKLHRIHLEEAEENACAARLPDPQVKVQPANLAYVIYTSGSTGQPKGAALTHAALSNLVDFQRSMDGFSGPGWTLQFSALGFDVSLQEMLTTWASGGALSIAGEEERKDPAALLDLLDTEEIERIFLPWTALRQLVQAGQGDGRFPKRLRQVVTAGEQLQADEQLKAWLARSPACRLHNQYGPSETHVATAWTSKGRPGCWPPLPPIGRPIANTRVYLLDQRMSPVPRGAVGEIYAAGVCLARGYLDRPGRTSCSFLPDPFSSEPGSRLYRTGDLARWDSSGQLRFLGRSDGQIKVRGFRVETGEVESALRSHPGIREAAVRAAGAGAARQHLLAYVVFEDGCRPTPQQLRLHLARILPDYMRPRDFIALDQLPLTPSGKLDRNALPEPPPTPSPANAPQAAAASPLEERLYALWRQLLGKDSLGVNDNFFDLGGHSLLLVELQHLLQTKLNRRVSVVDLFRYPNIRMLAEFLERPASALRPDRGEPQPREARFRDGRSGRLVGPTSNAVAVVGMAGRFPGARNLDEFWRNLRDGIESVRTFSDEELASCGVPRELLNDPRFVKAGAALEDADQFDAEFFGISPLEAELLNPQQRVFLECAWEALEDAGYSPETCTGPTGVYAGGGGNAEYARRAYADPKLRTISGSLLPSVSNDNDYLPTRVSYKLNLKGPSFNVQTACSTSLVALHLACRELLEGRCGTAIAGGVSIPVPLKWGYFTEGLPFAADGHCRAFDEDAQGAVEGSGCGVAVLKRLPDALAQGDRIRAVIRGSWINNDGDIKAGFAAPSIQGQSAVIEQALRNSGVDPESVSYVETHGTATPVGDPIEVAALTQAFRRSGAVGNRYCAIGSVKTNIGHLGAAAGIAGVIKTVLSLENGQLPPSLHFKKANPRIDFHSSPFFVNAKLRRWKSPAGPRRAGVSAFGIGGTNAHMVLEEAPKRAGRKADSDSLGSLLVLSARSPQSLEKASRNLAAHLKAKPEIDLADVAHTLQTGRRAFSHRRFAVCDSSSEAWRALNEPDPLRTAAVPNRDSQPDRIFLFPGLGHHHVFMGQGLYRSLGPFRDAMEDCRRRLLPFLGMDLFEALYPRPSKAAPAGSALGRIPVALAAQFSLEYALSSQWEAWGVTPQAMLGHSLGEYVAALLSGVFDLQAALQLVVRRGQLIESTPPGRMLAISLSESELQPLLGPDVSLAAVNGPSLCVAAGAEGPIKRLQAQLQKAGSECRRLKVSRAGHSHLLDSVLPDFKREIEGIELRPPRKRWISNLSGDWITPEQAIDPDYWVDHLRGAVRFSQGLETLLEDCPRSLLLEVGPGNSLGSLVRLHQGPGGPEPIASLPHPRSKTSDGRALLSAVGRLWLAGVGVSWEAIGQGSRRRVGLPTYPFERRRFWLESQPIEKDRRGENRSPSSPCEEAAENGAGPNSQPLDGAPAEPLDTGGGTVADRLAEVWKETLGLEEIGVDDDFFDIGGHSLTATRIVARIQELFSIELPLKAVFETPTIAGLAGCIRSALQQSAGTSHPPIGPRSPDLVDSAPLSFAQQRLWFVDRLMPSSRAYIIPMAWRLKGRLNTAALQGSLNGILRRHESLRTIFREVEGSPVQIITGTSQARLPIIDLTALSHEQRQHESRRLRRCEARRPFDLERGPLLRTQLVRLEEEADGAGLWDFLITMHHIVSDAWSMGVFAQDLSALYRAATDRARSPLPQLPFQYADFGIWQRNWLRGEELNRMLSFWRERIEGSAPFEIPCSRPAPELREQPGGRVDFKFSGRVSRQIRSMAKSNNVTLYMALLAAYSALLQRWSGQTDLVIGSPIANRNHPGTEGLIGFFVNSLAMRADLADNPTFLEHSHRVRQAALSAYAHQDLPFELLVQELKPDRSLGRNPLFQTVFALQNAPFQELKIDGLQADPLEAETATTRFDLETYVWDQGPQLDGTLYFNCSLMTHPQAQLVATRFMVIIQGICEAPDRRISELPFLSKEERRQLIERAQEEIPSIPQGLIHQAFSAQAVRRSSHQAVLCPQGSLSYGELESRSNRVARFLRRLGAGPESVVGICLKPSLDLPIALLGILKAGCAYLPLDPAYPQARLRFMLDDAKAFLILTQSSQAARFAGSDVPMVCIDRDQKLIAQENSGAAPDWTSADNLAYIAYTSGSTGRPKGVAIRHRSILRIVCATGAVRFGPDETILHLAPLSFDASALEIWGPLLNGGRLAIAGRSEFSLSDLGRALRASQATTLWLTAGLFHQMVEERLMDLQPLRQLASGGDALASEKVDKALAMLPGMRLVNGYGPSENTIFTTCHVMQESRRMGGPVPIGRPVADTAVYVADRHGRLAPWGVPGELVAGGEGLARGYLGRPALTAERFVPDPFGPTPGARLYRSGDLVRWRQDGVLTFLGRIDHQVKVRGCRIELGEVEAALLRNPMVREAAATVLPDASGDKALAAYVVLRPSAQASLDEIAADLKAQLPDYMTPSFFVTLDRLPLTAQGKLDRAALPRPAVRSGSHPSEPIPNACEAQLVEIFAEVLQRQSVGRSDDFFRLGGHSLLATQAIARIETVFGIQAPLRWLFEAPTAAALARRIEPASSSPQTREIRQRQRGSHVPLSFAQQRLWFLHQMLPANPRYNMPQAIRLQGDLDQAALERAFAAIVRRHESLRTRLIVAERGPQQAIDPQGTVPIARVDLRALEAEGRAAAADRICIEESLAPFDLERQWPLRIRLLLLDGREQVLLITLHHAAADGWSLGVFNRELATFYDAFSAGREPEIEDLPLQYADYAIRQREWMRGDGLQAQLRYWKQRLKGLEPLRLPFERPRTGLRRFRGGIVRFRLEAELRQRLEALSQRCASTLFMTVLTAFQTLLHRCSGHSDVAVGSPVANRNRVEIEGLIGFFVNMLVMRSDLSGDPSFLESLKRVRKAAIDAFAHQDIPFERIVEELRPERDLNLQPIFRTVMALQNAPWQELRLRGLRTLPAGAEYSTARFDLELHLVQSGDGLEGLAAFSRDVFERRSIERLVKRFQLLLEEAADRPESPISRMAFLTSQERIELLGAVSDFGSAAPEGAALDSADGDGVAGMTWPATAEAGPDSPQGAASRPSRLVQHWRTVFDTLHVRSQGQGQDWDDFAGWNSSFTGRAIPREEMLEWADDSAGRILSLRPRGVLEIGCGTGLMVGRIAPFCRRYLACDFSQEALSSLQLKLDHRKEPLSQVELHHREADDLEWLPQRSFDVVVINSVVQYFPNADYLLRVLQGACRTLRPGGSVYVGDVRCLPLLSMFHATAIYSALESPIRRDQARRRLEERLEAENELVLDPEFFAALPERLPRVSDVRLLLRRGKGDNELVRYRYDALLQVEGEPSRPPANRCRWPEAGGGLPELERLVEASGNRSLLVSGICNARLCRDAAILGWMLEEGSPDAMLVPAQAVGRGHRTGAIDPQSVWELEKALGCSVEISWSKDATRFDALFVPQPDLPVAESSQVRRRPGGKSWAEMANQPNVGLAPPAAASPQPAARNRDAKRSVAPRDELEERLAAIWRYLLELDSVGVRDDFFDRGGHSLLAAEAVSRIRKQFGAALSLMQFFETPTIEGLAARLRSESRGSESPAPVGEERLLIESLAPAWAGREGERVRRLETLAPLQSQGRRRPLFCIHPGSGSAGCYLDLARRLGEDQPTYGLNAKGLDGRESPLESLEEMARSYLQAVRSVQPRGPYQLLGWSFGGLPAFEMAQQLVKDGEAVSLLALIDTWAPIPEQQRLVRDSAADADAAAAALVEEMLQTSAPTAMPGAASRQENEGSLPPVPDPSWLKGCSQVLKACRRAYRIYEARRYSSSLLVIRPREELTQDAPLDLGWGRLSSHVETQVAPGGHFSLIREPLAAELAAVLMTRLQVLDSDSEAQAPGCEGRIPVTDPWHEERPKTPSPRRPKR